jgi:hypothetical protein
MEARNAMTGVVVTRRLGRLNMFTVLIYVLILWGVIVLAWLGAWLQRRHAAHEPGQLRNVALFIGFLFGFLLSALQVFATNHYSDARTQAQAEPTSLVTLYDHLAVLPPHARTRGEGTLVCYMWSVAKADWKAQERGATLESAYALEWGGRLRYFSNELPQDTPAAQRISTDVTAAGSARQQLLFLARPQIPPILWIVVFVSGGVLIFLQVSDAPAGKIVSRTMLVAVIVVMTLEVASLAILDRPFSPIGGIKPTAMTDAIGLLTAGRTDLPTWHDCVLQAGR